MIKWVEIAANPSTERFQFLSKYLKNHGLENEVSFIQATEDNLKEKVAEAKKQFQQIRIGPPFGEEILDSQVQWPDLMLTLQSSDALVMQDGKWWPRSFFYEGYLRELTTRVKSLDLNASALLVGSGAAIRAVFAALLKLGFSRFNFTDRFEERGHILVKDLKKVYFNASINFVQPAALTTLPGIHPILVNATPLIPTNDLLEDLYYFNFFKPGGAVIDLNLIPTTTPLIAEAEKAGCPVIRGYELAGQTDSAWAEHCFGIKIDLEEYRNGLKEILDKIPFDLSGFKKI